MSAPEDQGTPDGEDAPVTVIGIGADGWDTLSRQAQQAIEQAGAVIGGPRQLDLLPAHVRARRITWGKPLRDSVRPLVEEYAPLGLVVLASGDPWHYGIGRTLAGQLSPGRLRVMPSASSMSLACARLGWPVESAQVVHALGADVSPIRRIAYPGTRMLVLVPRGESVLAVATHLSEAGLGASEVWVLGDLGSARESCVQASAAQWLAGPPADPGTLPRLAIVAIEVAAEDPGRVPALVPGLPDDSFHGDGQLTKWEVRAFTLAALAPRPGELLWDVGAGSGTISVEWCRAHGSCAAVAIETRADRSAHIAANARAFGVPCLRVVHGQAPDALAGLPRPDAVFIGGGFTAAGLLEACWEALPPGGRLVANVVTLESEAALVAARSRLGGELGRIQVSQAEPVGSFSAWAAARPVTQWRVTRPR